MLPLAIRSPFDAPVYYRETVDSTMDEARFLAAVEHGTVIAADYQKAGRGRSGRLWCMEKGENLSFTVILNYPVEALPSCLTLKAGLAVSSAIEDFALSLGASKNAVQVKWPNDVMLVSKDGSGKKAAGILAEASGGNVYLGIGINTAQRSFPPELENKACSIAAFFGLDPALTAENRFRLLEAVLSHLKAELEDPSDWRIRLERRLFMKGRQVRFVPGAPEDLWPRLEILADKTDFPFLVQGTLRGIKETGEILIETEGRVLSFITGELQVYGKS